MKDINILSYVGRSLWAITEDKWAEMVPALIRHAKGTKLTDDELQAFMGGRDKEPAQVRKQGDAVAIVPIRGVIAHRMEAMSMSSGGASCESIKAMLQQAFADASVGTIVLDVDSPGGTVTGCTELAAWLFEAKGRGSKNVIAVANGQMCSAAYWIASQADEIVAIPSADVGSIGVFAAHKDISEALAKDGIKITLIKSEKFKAEGNPFEPLSEEAEARLQARVDDAGATFRKDVGRGRGITAAQVREQYGAGLSFGAKDALAAGLIDRIATMDAVLSKLVGKSSGGMRAEDEGPALAAAAETELTAAEAATAISDEMRQRLERF